MVHGTCSSRGCFAMTDAAMGEIYALAARRLRAGSGPSSSRAFRSG
jgi:murein L,D-transpeptidase YafK